MFSVNDPVQRIQKVHQTRRLRVTYGLNTGWMQTKYPQRLKAHLHRAEAKKKKKIFFDVCRLSFDLFWLFFDLFLFHSVWIGPKDAESSKDSDSKYSLHVLSSGPRILQRGHQALRGANLRHFGPMCGVCVPRAPWIRQWFWLKLLILLISKFGKCIFASNGNKTI